MSTINPFSMSTAVNSLSLSLSFGQFNLNNNRNRLNSSLSSNLNSDLNSNLNSSSNSNPNSSLSNSDDSPNQSSTNSNSSGNQSLFAPSLTSSPNQLGSHLLIHDKLNDVNLCSKLSTSSGKRDSPPNVSKFLCQRSYGNRTPSLSADFGLQHLILNNLLREDQIDLGTIDKVYSSCWIDDDFVLCGTKCNKLILINLNNKKQYYLPVVQSLKSAEKSNGIYSIVTNPSRTLLATGTKDGFDIAVYRMPSLDILYQLTGGHEDLIFDMVWLDDQFLLSASRDSNVVLWKVDGDDLEVDPVSNLYKMKTEEPTNLFNYEEIEKIRCMNFVRKRNEISVLTSNCKLHTIDAVTMRSNQRPCNLTYGSDLCCLANNEDSLYAVGSNSHIQLIDSRSFNIVSTINSKSPECRIRSMSFNSEILTLTTGFGNVLFYDIRNSRYFHNQLSKELVVLKASKGWNRPVNQENQNFGYFSQPDLPAIYTHSYDKGRTRLFTAGGPLQAMHVGNYCGIWS